MQPHGLAYAGIGSRQTPPNVQGVMVDLADELRRQGWTLRSGHADSADQAFEAGAGREAEIYLPWPSYNRGVRIVSQKILGEPAPAAYAIAKDAHPAWWRLALGAQRLHARNSHIVLGQDLASPCTFVVCWTDGGKVSGGTGQAIRIATKLAIPVFNLALCDTASVVAFARGRQV